ncbi:molybdopterin converting factor, subunit 1 [Actinomyces bovis]|uniref:Molybdopterin synthase sulfur carrier subunit n=1 Tax=Actinomyces bovis TaxID=1658 RepID=A0ABY1VMS8_9ACTO|nr:MoaD/ThiS family protein [Actinomyces bovis]SPT53365.1 molybdopterin converting factor, subunit 1 [Actinomyces bovis]VEG52745.1 molybdopterin converting factor, subunit 1 [Actinomyces israelii]
MTPKSPNTESALTEGAQSPAGGARIVVTLRYFAAAAEAAGRPEELVELPAGSTLAGLRAELAGRGTQMAKVVGLSTFLLNAVATPADALAPLSDGDRVDLLPPFAGG